MQPDAIEAAPIGLKYYSTEIAAAWEVVEKVIVLGTELNIFPNFPGLGPDSESEKWEDKKCFHVSPGMCDDFGCTDKCATAESAPHAICLAALKAVAK